MSYYSSFITLNKTPKRRFLSDLQALVSRDFEASATVSCADDGSLVEEEVEFSTLDFSPVEARIVSITDSKTGQRNNNDYRCIIFKDIEHNVCIGKRYRFGKNVWITYSITDISTSSNNAYVRRCNNVLNMQDEYGNIHTEPCYVDEGVLETRVFRSLKIDVPQARYEIIVQKNKFTEKIKLNDRFLFGDSAYIVRTKSGFDRQETYNDSSNLIRLYVELDNNNQYDNFELMVANYKEYDYRLVFDEDVSVGLNNSGVISASVYLQDSLVNEKLKYISSNEEIIKVDENGNYSALGVGDCTVDINMINKKDVMGKISFHVLENKQSDYDVMITPDIDNVKTNKTEIFNVYEYNNGEKTNTEFIITYDDIPKKYCNITSDKNSFTISVYRYYNKPVNVYCQNQRTGDTITKSISLGGV